MVKGALQINKNVHGEGAAGQNAQTRKSSPKGKHAKSAVKGSTGNTHGISAPLHTFVRECVHLNTVSPLTSEQSKYLQRKVVSESDPGVLVCWHVARVGLAVDAINTNPGLIARVRPAYIGDVVPMTVDGLTNAIIHYLGGFGGGIFGSLIAPNTAVQYGRVLMGLRSVESDPYMQAIMAVIGPGPIARIGCIADKTACTPLLVPPTLGAMVQVFE